MKGVLALKRKADEKNANVDGFYVHALSHSHTLYLPLSANLKIFRFEIN